jgi:hypothetical protein
LTSFNLIYIISNKLYLVFKLILWRLESRATGRREPVGGHKEDAARTVTEGKERGCTVRLFGKNSLKEGAV